MKPIWSGILWSLEGAIAATFISGVLVGVLDWRLDTTPKIAVFLGVVLAGATLGWVIGMAMARRKAPLWVARFKPF